MLGLITQRQIINSFGTKCDQLESEYINYFEKLDINLRIISNFQSIKVGNFDLLILTGGGSIHKEQPDRDNIEKKLFEYALKNGIPIIGICRGMQYINIMLSGSISENATLKVDRPNKIDHSVKIKDDIIKVNNYHNDIIFYSDLSNELEPLAIDVENETIEAYYKKGILGVQWHPEREFTDEYSKNYSTNLIKKFINNRGIL